MYIWVYPSAKNIIVILITYLLLKFCFEQGGVLFLCCYFEIDLFIDHIGLILLFLPCTR